jgi:hypothetical protein
MNALERLFGECTGFSLKSQDSAFQPESFRKILRATEALRMTISEALEVFL